MTTRLTYQETSDDVSRCSEERVATQIRILWFWVLDQRQSDWSANPANQSGLKTLLPSIPTMPTV